MTTPPARSDAELAIAARRELDEARRRRRAIGLMIERETWPTVEALFAEARAAGRAELEARVGGLEAALAAVQWGSCDGCGIFGYCPLCHEPQHEWGNDDEPVPGKHKPDCIVGRALKG